MMWIGLLTIAAAAALYAWYRPRWGEGAKLCVLCLAMGLGGLAAGDGSPLFVAAEALLSAVSCVCGLFCLHREKVLRERAMARRAAAKSAPSASSGASRGPVKLTVLHGGTAADRGCA